KTAMLSTHILPADDALCHRVAVLNKGKLRGLSVIAELVAQNRSRFEVVWQGPAAIPTIRNFGNEIHVAGEVARTIVKESQVQTALETLRSNSVQLVSVNPVGGSLEEYFLQKLGERKNVVQ